MATPAQQYCEILCIGRDGVIDHGVGVLQAYQSHVYTLYACSDHNFVSFLQDCRMPLPESKLDAWFCMLPEDPSRDILCCIAVLWFLPLI